MCTDPRVCDFEASDNPRFARRPQRRVKKGRSNRKHSCSCSFYTTWFRKSREYNECVCVQGSNLKVNVLLVVRGAPEMRENLDANKATPIGAAVIDMTAAHEMMITGRRLLQHRGTGTWAEAERTHGYITYRGVHRGHLRPAITGPLLHCRLPREWVRKEGYLSESIVEIVGEGRWGLWGGCEQRLAVSIARPLQVSEGVSVVSSDAWHWQGSAVPETIPRQRMEVVCLTVLHREQRRALLLGARDVVVYDKTTARGHPY